MYFLKLRRLIKYLCKVENVVISWVCPHWCVKNRTLPSFTQQYIIRVNSILFALLSRGKGCWRKYHNNKTFESKSFSFRFKVAWNVHLVFQSCVTNFLTFWCNARTNLQHSPFFPIAFVFVKVEQIASSIIIIHSVGKSPKMSHFKRQRCACPTAIQSI